MAESAVTPNPIAEYEAGFAVDTRRAGGRALIAAFVGFFVDMFDVYLPTVAWAPSMSFSQPDPMSTAAKSTLFYIVFALSLVGRPVGATVFGPYADRLGR